VIQAGQAVCDIGKGRKGQDRTVGMPVALKIFLFFSNIEKA
jgi:hypothetical protein